MTDLNSGGNEVSGNARKKRANPVTVEFLPKTPDLIKVPLPEVEGWVGGLPLDEEKKKKLLETIDNLRRF